MTPLEFIRAWHSAARLAVPRIVPDGWQRQAVLLIERGITSADLELVAKWMRTQEMRSNLGERGAVGYNAASFAWRKMFGDYGGEAEGNEFARFAELLAFAEAARRPPARAVQGPCAAAERPARDDAEAARISAAGSAAMAETLRKLGGPQS
jgi:hypothetical protein